MVRSTACGPFRQPELKLFMTPRLGVLQGGPPGAPQGGPPGPPYRPLLNSSYVDFAPSESGPPKNGPRGPPKMGPPGGPPREGGFGGPPGGREPLRRSVLTVGRTATRGVCPGRPPDHPLEGPQGPPTEGPPPGGLPGGSPRAPLPPPVSVDSWEADTEGAEQDLTGGYRPARQPVGLPQLGVRLRRDEDNHSVVLLRKRRTKEERHGAIDRMWTLPSA